MNFLTFFTKPATKTQSTQTPSDFETDFKRAVKIMSQRIREKAKLELKRDRDLKI